MISTLYRGSVKDVLGPIKKDDAGAVIFEYSDAYSVFDWGKMPDLLTLKGKALAVIAAEFFERLEQPESWREFSKTPEALALRKANRYGASFNELGEDLQTIGLKTHYLGHLASSPAAGASFSEDMSLSEKPKRILAGSSPGSSDFLGDEPLIPFRRMMVREVSVVKPKLASVLGRVLPDYSLTRTSSFPRLVPLEVIFRFSLPPGSSLLERVQKDPSYLTNMGYSDLNVAPGAQFSFPMLELFTKLEPTDRAVSLAEGLALSGLASHQLQELLFKTVWVAGILRFWCRRAGLELADGKLEWAIDQDGKIFLVDAIGPDELRLMKDGIPLSKEFLRHYYRNTAWFSSVERAKAQSKAHGLSDWKRGVADAPPSLPPKHRELASQLYLALANELTGRKWFQDSWSLDRVIEEVKGMQAKGIGE